jgi:PKD repeat protein
MIHPLWSKCSSLSALMLSAICTFSVSLSVGQTAAWPTHSHDSQHTGISSVASQAFGHIHWSTPVDLARPTGEILIHYGSPLVTAANTVIVPVKTGTNSFRVEAHNGATGSLLWMQNTGWVAPSAGFMPGLGPTLFGNKLFVPDSGGRVMVRSKPDLAKGAISRLVFYGLKNYLADPKVYRQKVDQHPADH